jgi:hypothetical protein
VEETFRLRGRERAADCRDKHATREVSLTTGTRAARAPKITVEINIIMKTTLRQRVNRGNFRTSQRSRR